MTLRVLLFFAEQIYIVKTYIDSQDPLMLKVMSAETATQIKDRISRCDKFILLQLIEPLIRCNWELVFGDAKNIISILLCFQ